MLPSYLSAPFVPNALQDFVALLTVVITFNHKAYTYLTLTSVADEVSIVDFVFKGCLTFHLTHSLQPTREVDENPASCLSGG